MEQNWLVEMLFTPQPDNDVPVRYCGHSAGIGNDGERCILCGKTEEEAFEGLLA